MLWPHRLNIVCLSIAINLLVPAYSYAEDPSVAGSTASSKLSSVLEHLKNNSKDAAAELLNTLVPKATQYAKDVGYAAFCNEPMVRKNHDDMQLVVSFVYKQTLELVRNIEASFAKSNVAETILAVQANDKEAVKNTSIEMYNRGKLRSSILLTIFPLKKLISSLRDCERDTLQFPTEIHAKLVELESHLDAINTHLLSKNWLIPEIRGSTIEELNTNVNKNAKENLSKEALALQIANLQLNKLVVNYLNTKNENDVEKLKQELEALQ